MRHYCACAGGEWLFLRRGQKRTRTETCLRRHGLKAEKRHVSILPRWESKSARHLESLESWPPEGDCLSRRGESARYEIPVRKESWTSSRVVGCSVACFLSAQAVLLGWAGWRACPNKTEVGHMAASVYFWHTLRFDFFHVNPPLTRIVSGLPVVLCGPNCDWDCYSTRPQDRAEWGVGKAFIAANDPWNVRWYFAIARWSLIPILLLGGYMGYRLSRDVYGASAGLLFWLCGVHRRCCWPGERPSAPMPSPPPWALRRSTRCVSGSATQTGRGPPSSASGLDYCLWQN